MPVGEGAISLLFSICVDTVTTYGTSFLNQLLQLLEVLPSRELNLLQASLHDHNSTNILHSFISTACITFITV